jgi:squalene monooxygenase
MRLQSHDPASLASRPFDVIIVGAGAVGSALAYGLGQSGRQVLLMERDLAEPDRIVGELLQPGGCQALQSLGMLDCLDGIDARLCRGYHTYWGRKSVPIPYPLLPAEDALPFGEAGLSGLSQTPEDGTRAQGRSFHHGRFIQSLRRKAITCPNVFVLEATVTDIIRSPDDPDTVVGVYASPSAKATFPSPSSATLSKEALPFYAPLTIVSDGYASKFRKLVTPDARPPIVRSHFVALLLKDADMPAPGYGHVILRDLSTFPPDQVPDRAGPVLVYQLSEHDTRMLVDVPGSKLPSIGNGDLKVRCKCVALHD